jgi:hypothetical protein
MQDLFFSAGTSYAEDTNTSLEVCFRAGANTAIPCPFCRNTNMELSGQARFFFAAFRLAAQRFFIIIEMRFRAAGLILRRPALFAPAVRVVWRPVLSLPKASRAVIARSIRPFSPRKSLISFVVFIFRVLSFLLLRNKIHCQQHRKPP